MDSYIFNYIVLVSVSGVLSLLLAFFSFYTKGGFAGSKTFFWINIASCFYVFGYAFGLTGSSLAEIEWMTRMQYLGLPFISPLYIILVMQFIGLDTYLTRKLIAKLFVVPVVTVLVVWTNDMHHLFYRSLTVQLVDSYLLTEFTIGIFYVIHGSYTFGCLFAAIMLLLWNRRKIKSAYNLQLFAMTAALLIPMVASFLYLIGLFPYNMDPVPIVMCVTSGFYLIVILSFRMMKVAPIAKELVFEHMRDGVVVLDSFDQIVDFNEAAQQMIPGLANSFIGKNIFESWNQLMGTPKLPSWPDDDRLAVEEELHWKHGGKKVHCLFRAFPILQKNEQLGGRTIVFTDITKEIMLREALEERANKDGLTRIFNRAKFIEASNSLIAAKKNLSIILFDIDRFKAINDTYGHDVGDEALVHVVEVCSSLLAAEYIFARYGGEEFVLALPDVCLEEACQFAEDLRAQIAASAFTAGSESISVTASFGVAEGGKHPALAKMLKEADQALYAAKRKGRNTVICQALSE